MNLLFYADYRCCNKINYCSINRYVFIASTKYDTRILRHLRK